jgi:hypothetical protein
MKLPGAVTLYRFMSAQAGLQTLESMRLRVGRLSNLNDPFDCAPHLGGAPADLFERNYGDSVMAQVAMKVHENKGILCFTRVWNEPVLWSHYADSHRGMALVFRWPDLPNLIRVKYSKTRAMVPYSYVRDSKAPGAEEAIAAAYQTKSPAWRYEREVRLLINLERCGVRDGHFHFDLPVLVLAGVILGLNCAISSTYVRKVLNHNKVPHAKVWATRKSRTKFALEREEV